MALRDLLRRPAAPESPAPPSAAPGPVHDDWSVDAPGFDDDWSVEPGFAPPVPVERPAESPAESPAAWTAAAEPIDVTDHTVELPALAAPPRDLGRRAWRTALTLALVLVCAGAALAAGGVLRSKDQMPAPVRIGAAPITSHTLKVKPRPKPAVRPRRRAPRPHRAPAPRHVAVAPAHVVAAAPSAPAARPAPVRHVVSAPAPKPVAGPTPAPAPKPKPKPTTTTTAAQPAPSAPSGEPGRQPPPTP